MIQIPIDAFTKSAIFKRESEQVEIHQSEIHTAKTKRQLQGRPILPLNFFFSPELALTPFISFSNRFWQMKNGAGRDIFAKCFFFFLSGNFLFFLSFPSIKSKMSKGQKISQGCQTRPWCVDWLRLFYYIRSTDLATLDSTAEKSFPHSREIQGWQPTTTTEVEKVLVSLFSRVKKTT